MQVLFWVFRMAVGGAMSSFMAYAAFALGPSLALHHKAAAGVGLIVAFSWGSGLADSLLSLLFGSMFSIVLGDGSLDAALAVLDAAGMLFDLCLGIACYFICAHVLNRKVNLPWQVDDMRIPLAKRVVWP